MLSWRGSPADRIESLHARATDYTQEKILRETVMNQEETVRHTKEKEPNQNKQKKKTHVVTM